MFKELKETILKNVRSVWDDGRPNKSINNIEIIKRTKQKFWSWKVQWWKWKSHRRGSTTDLKWQMKESSILKIGQLRSFSINNKKKKNEEKWTEPQRPVGNHKAYQHMCNRSQRIRGKSEMGRNSIWRYNGQWFQILKKNNLYIQSLANPKQD